MEFINGNGKAYEKGLPLLVIQDYFNDGALKHIEENTGLHFTPGIMGWLTAQPTTAEQVAKLFMTYNFKTRYYDNMDFRNTLMLRGDHHTGFDVKSICLDCCKHNHIHTMDLKEGDRLAC